MRFWDGSRFCLLSPANCACTLLALQAWRPEGLVSFVGSLPSGLRNPQQQAWVRQLAANAATVRSRMAEACNTARAGATCSLASSPEQQAASAQDEMRNGSQATVRAPKRAGTAPLSPISSQLPASQAWCKRHKEVPKHHQQAAAAGSTVTRAVAGAKPAMSAAAVPLVPRTRVRCCVAVALQSAAQPVSSDASVHAAGKQPSAISAANGAASQAAAANPQRLDPSQPAAAATPPLEAPMPASCGRCSSTGPSMRGGCGTGSQPALASSSSEQGHAAESGTDAAIISGSSAPLGQQGRVAPGQQQSQAPPGKRQGQAACGQREEALAAQSKYIADYRAHLQAVSAARQKEQEERQAAGQLPPSLYGAATPSYSSYYAGGTWPA